MNFPAVPRSFRAMTGRLWRLHATPAASEPRGVLVVSAPPHSVVHLALTAEEAYRLRKLLAPLAAEHDPSVPMRHRDDKATETA